MLWLAGLMGLMAVGAVAFVDPQLNEDDEEDFVGSATRQADDEEESPVPLSAEVR